MNETRICIHKASLISFCTENSRKLASKIGRFVEVRKDFMDFVTRLDPPLFSHTALERHLTPAAEGVDEQSKCQIFYDLVA